MTRQTVRHPHNRDHAGSRQQIDWIEPGPFVSVLVMADPKNMNILAKYRKNDAVFPHPQSLQSFKPSLESRTVFRLVRQFLLDLVQELGDDSYRQFS